MQNWYALQTKPQREKEVNFHLESKGYTTYFPLIQCISKQKNGAKSVMKPFISGYVFVRLSLAQAMILRTVPCSTRFVCLNGLPCRIPDAEIEMLQHALDHNAEAVCNKQYNTGEKVEVLSGPFSGFTGHVVEDQQNKRVLITMSCIGAAFIVDIGHSQIRACLKIKVHR
ncbi:MAG: UpxY family transcription antiterminator, partial [Bacteroidetes bacterium]|nr:UpxY family transcription antiterminator [Bacteroidota bacterium]